MIETANEKTKIDLVAMRTRAQPAPEVPERAGQEETTKSNLREIRAFIIAQIDKRNKLHVGRKTRSWFDLKPRDVILFRLYAKKSPDEKGRIAINDLVDLAHSLKEKDEDVIIWG